MSGYVARQNEKQKPLLEKFKMMTKHLVLWTSLNKHSNTSQQCTPKLAHFLSKLWGKISGLLAGGQVLLAWILQYTRSQPHLIEVCWECNVDTFASFEKRIVKLKARRLICNVAVTRYSAKPGK